MPPVTKELENEPDAIPVGELASAPEFLQARWYAAYTAPRHEKRVTQQMDERQIHCFLPLYRSVRRWKDRRKQLDLPLFPGYVFVHLALRDRLRVLQLPGVVQLVSFCGKPAALPDAEIEALRNGLEGNVCAEPHPYLAVGRRVRIRGIGGGPRRHPGTAEAEVPSGAFDGVDPAFDGHRSRRGRRRTAPR